MNKDEIGGNWTELQGKTKEKRGKLTHDEITAIDGKGEQLVGKIQARDGSAKDNAEKTRQEGEHKNDYRW